MSGQIFLQAAEISVSETDGTVFIVIERTGDTTEAVTVEYATTDLDADSGDYVSQSGFVTIPAGASQVVVPITILDDGFSEPTEAFSFSLINVDGGALLFPRTARVSILDDENPVTDPVSPPTESNYNVTESAIFSDLTQPIAIEWIPTNPDIAFIAEQTGVIYAANTATGGDLTVVLDLSDQVNNRQDRGLLDIAVHPDLENNPYLYAFYVVDPSDTQGNSGNAGPDGGGNRFSHVVRFTLDESTGYTTVVEGSETILLGAAGQSLSDISGGGAIDSTSPSNINVRDSEIDPNTGEYIPDYIKVDSRSHAGGALEFGPDGALYVSTGDGTSFNTTDPRSVSVQDVDSLAGKILRIDPITGEGFSDNPFFTGDVSDNASKVYQLGLRNPFSMSFDEEGRLLITDTGWNSYEEINLGGPGANFGWPFYEGGDNGQLIEANGYRDLPEAAAFYAAVAAGDIDITPAFRAFSHNSNDPGFQLNAITGADDVIDSDLYPDSLQNFYLFTDVTQGEIYVVDANDRRDVQLLYETDGYAPVHFKQSPDGVIWFVDIVSGRVGILEITERAEPALTAEYFALPAGISSLGQIDFDAAPIATELVREINQDAGSGAFYPGGPSDDFAVRYTGTFEAEAAGVFDFFLTSDDGAQLFINGQLVVDNDGLHAPVEETGSLSLGEGSHTIEVIYFERGGGALVDLDWSGPGFARTQMVFEAPATNVINGTSGNDVLEGTDEADTMFGNGGSDVFRGSLGDDDIIGNANDYDELSLAGSSDDYIFSDNGDGTYTVTGDLIGTDTLTDIDGVWFRGAQEWSRIEELATSSGLIEGTPGDDVLFGSDGDDTMIGNGGSDVFRGSLGDDDIIGNANDYDELSLGGSSADYTFTDNGDGTITLTGDLVGTDTLTDIDGVWFRGAQQWSNINDLLDTPGGLIEGTSGNDILFGSDGVDTMIGNGGRDVFRGSLGDDTIIGNAGEYDELSLAGSAADYTFIENGDGTVTVTGDLIGTDTLEEIDGVWFRGAQEWFTIADLFV